MVTESISERCHGLAPWRFTRVATTGHCRARMLRPGAVEVHAGGYCSSQREPPRDQRVASVSAITPVVVAVYGRDHAFQPRPQPTIKAAQGSLPPRLNSQRYSTGSVSDLSLVD